MFKGEADGNVDQQISQGLIGEYAEEIGSVVWQPELRGEFGKFSLEIGQKIKLTDFQVVVERGSERKLREVFGGLAQEIGSQIEINSGKGTLMDGVRNYLDGQLEKVDCKLPVFVAKQWCDTAGVEAELAYFSLAHPVLVVSQGNRSWSFSVGDNVEGKGRFSLVSNSIDWLVGFSRRSSTSTRSMDLGWLWGDMNFLMLASVRDKSLSDEACMAIIKEGKEILGRFFKVPGFDQNLLKQWGLSRDPRNYRQLMEQD